MMMFQLAEKTDKAMGHFVYIYVLRPDTRIIQKIKLSIKDLFSKCNQIDRFLDRNLQFLCNEPLCEKCPYTEFFVVRIFPYSD